MMDTYDKMHWVVIRVIKNHDIIEFHRWTNLRFEIRNKWDWYFKYRAALCQVKHPRAKVEFAWGSEDAVGKTKLQLMESRIVNKTRLLTRHKNLLQKAILEWDQIFPIEDDLMYKRVVSKIKNTEFELQQLIEEKAEYEKQM